MIRWLLLILAVSVAWRMNAASRTIVKEYDRVFTTYPYSDPDPVPAMSKFYPYFRYDGFTDQAVQKTWKVVELSNDYVQLLILPEIGGKIWAAVEKSTGRPFIYFNHVVKFRDVAMRGPWTSGGIEANYGIIGHTPNCSSPVDYLVRRNPDRSASCFIGVLDLLTRTSWRLEINLPADQACFTTRSLWQNSSGEDQPYYTWMNVGIKANGNLQFINPGTHYLGHDGEFADWPVNPRNGHDISWYEQNNFGPYKSYHVFGRFAEFFGGYWHDDDFGMARCSTYRDKPGRKVWIWGLSRQGMIWEKLLTDSDGQYVEVQSGRLFNQTAEKSALTPFKHKEFPPYSTDTWTEYWQPVKGIKGFVAASPWGAMNITLEGDNRLVIRISPTRTLHDTLQVFDGEQLLASQVVSLKPMQPCEKTVTLAAAPKALRVRLGDDKLQYVAGDQDILSRPLAAPAGFDWDSTYGLYLKGKESARQRNYPAAALEFQACLRKDPNFAPALVELAGLANRRGDFSNARDFARHALSVDTYDPGANYQFGRASAALGNRADAKEAFSISALSSGWRSAACTELARQYLREKEYDRALACAADSMENNARNLDGIQLQATTYRLQADAVKAEAAVESLLRLDPLNHFARCERFLRGRGSAKDFVGLIRNELPQETFLELASWYRGVGRDADAAQLLALAPPNAEVLYWIAYLRQDLALLSAANQASPAFVFPFRTESVPVFEWARQKSSAWQPRYYLALIRWYQGDLSEARSLLASCGSEPKFGPFYAARAQLAAQDPVPDLEQAARLDPGQWRYGVAMAKHYLQKNDPRLALEVADRFSQLFPGNTIIALQRANALVRAGQFRKAADLLAGLNILPCEGSTDAHSTYREAHLMIALEQMRAQAFDSALAEIAAAREWPENLGAGKPYPEDLDESVEDWLVYQCRVGRNAPAEARPFLAAARPVSRPTCVRDVVGLLMLKASGSADEVQKTVAAWRSESSTNEWARWGVEIVSGQTPHPPDQSTDVGVRIISAWAREKRGS